MAANPCEPSPCAGVSASIPSNCQCPDPGIVLSGLNVVVSDSGNCPRRLQPLRDGSLNVLNGLLVVQQDPSDEKTPYVTWTQQPAIPYPALAITANASFGSFVVATGTLGTHYRLTPPSTASLALQTDGAGGLKFAAFPATVIPDPLAIGTLTVNTTLNASGLLNIGNVNGASIPSGTISNALGLNASNVVVKGSPIVQTAKALYYEDTIRDNTQTNFPNFILGANASCYIGNELSDTAGIAHVKDSFTIQIDQAGSYQIDWSGYFTKPSVSMSPSVWLFVNGVCKSTGIISLNTTTSSGGTAVGSHLMSLNVGDQISLKIASTASLSAACQLKNLQLMLTRYSA